MSTKVNAGDNIKKTLIYLNQVNEGYEKNKQKIHSWKNVFLSFEINFFPECFYPPKFTIFWKSVTIQCVRWADKTHVFFW